MSRPRHPKKDVEASLRAAEGDGFEVTQKSAGHGWGFVVCKCGVRMTVWSTPKNPSNFSKKIDQFIRRHGHRGNMR